MPGRVNQPNRPGPPDLEDAIRNHPNCGLDGNLPFSGCQWLLWDFHYPPHAPMPYTWGFRIYRTTYGPPNKSSTDADFARAIEVLHEYMRYELFSYDHGQSLTLDGAPNDTAQTHAKNVLWRRLRNDIVQDREMLEGASPEKIIELAREWYPSQYEGAKVYHSSAFRYPLIVDSEVLQNLLTLPMPAEYDHSEAATYAIKVCDLRVDDCDEDDEEYMYMSSDEESVCEPEDDGYRGWFWIGAYYLVGLWFDEKNAATEEVCTWVNCPGRAERRFLFWRTGLGLGCMHSEAEHRAMYPSLFQGEDGGPGDVEPPSVATANPTLS